MSSLHFGVELPRSDAPQGRVQFIHKRRRYMVRWRRTAPHSTATTAKIQPVHPTRPISLGQFRGAEYVFVKVLALQRDVVL